MRVMILSVAILSGLCAGAMAADVNIEISAAQIRARSASRNVFKIEDIHTRMQGAINCLVGPKGEGFSAAAPNPCAASGNGVIPDSTDAAKKALFQQAAEKLKTGLSEDDRQKAMQIALDGADMIVAASGE